MNKIGIISDTHSNIQALSSLLEKEKEVEIWINAGDSCGLFPRVNEVLEILNSPKFISIKGNHDFNLCHNLPIEGSYTGTESLEKQREYISENNMNFVRSLPDSRRFELANRKIRLEHRLSAKSKYVFDPEIHIDSENLADITIFGDTHLPFLYYFKSALFINPGSLGFPINISGNSTYVILDLDGLSAEIKFLTFDVSSLISDVRSFGFNKKLITYLENGFKWP